MWYKKFHWAIILMNFRMTQKTNLINLNKNIRENHYLILQKKIKSKEWIYFWAQRVKIYFFVLCSVLIKRVDYLSKFENFLSNKYVSKMHTITNLVHRDKLNVNITKLLIKLSTYNLFSRRWFLFCWIYQM